MQILTLGCCWAPCGHPVSDQCRRPPAPHRVRSGGRVPFPHAAHTLRARTSSFSLAVDFGFEAHEEFDRGVVEVWKGESGLAAIHTLQNPLSAGQKFASLALITLSLAFPPYLLSKLTLVQKGEASGAA